MSTVVCFVLYPSAFVIALYPHKKTKKYNYYNHTFSNAAFCIQLKDGKTLFLQFLLEWSKHIDIT